MSASTKKRTAKPAPHESNGSRAVTVGAVTVDEAVVTRLRELPYEGAAHESLIQTGVRACRHGWDVVASLNGLGDEDSPTAVYVTLGGPISQQGTGPDNFQFVVDAERLTDLGYCLIDLAGSLRALGVRKAQTA